MSTFEQCGHFVAYRSLARTAFDCAREDLAPLGHAIVSAAGSAGVGLLRVVCSAGFVARMSIATAVALTATMCSYWAQSSARPPTSYAAPSIADLPRLQATEKADRLDAYVREERAAGAAGQMLGSAEDSPFVQWPLVNRVTTGVRVGPNGERIYGIRIAVPVGTPVRAAADGTVDFAGNSSDGYGKKIVIKHGTTSTIYAHASAILVKKSDKVRKGQVIARSGQSGFATSPRLYLGILGGGANVDPITFFAKAGTLGRCTAGTANCRGREPPARTAAAAATDPRPVPPSDIPPTRLPRPDHL